MNRLYIKVVQRVYGNIDGYKQQHNHENELKNKEIGWLGKFFGAEDNAARNMAMTVIILVSGGATVFSYV